MTDIPVKQTTAEYRAEEDMQWNPDMMGFCWPNLDAQLSFCIWLSIYVNKLWYVFSAK